MDNKNFNIIALRQKPELIDQAAAWFHQVWDIPMRSYLDSMTDALTAVNSFPRWYIILNEKEEIIAGIGVIENDFHKRFDLTPNLCALFVTEPYRKRGLAKALLHHACEQLTAAGIHNTYLITTHTDFYERCGWNFYGMIEENDGNQIRAYQSAKSK